MSKTAGMDSGGPSSPLAPPTIRTFLLADIRGYTRFTAERGDTAAAHLSELFLGLCREVVSSHDGEVFGSAGDQALAAFSSAGAALHAAIALQASLGEKAAAHPDLPLTAGVGLDAGEAIQVGSDFRGNPVNRAARLCSIAGGGEIFSSDTVITLASITEGIAAVDRGEVFLKGLSSPVRVVQIGPMGSLPDTLPPLQPILVNHPTNLPDDPTPFIGRAGEITEITTLVGQPGVRLVTLLGPGGTGKTRLALQIGNTLLHSFRDGVFFCDLSPLTDPTLVPSTIAEVLGVKVESTASVLDALIRYLQDKHLLLVLDNCEQVIEAASEVGRLLDGCREVHVMATSRTPLHLAREREYAVAPFPVPDATNLPPFDQLQQFDAIALFVERAGAARHGFTLTEENAPAVAAICSKLDGLPLAIELAAARIKLFAPAALLQRLDHRLPLLSGGAKDRPSRHQTLRATIDWSYSLLTEGEQRLFARLSVFAGGWTFEAAEAMCNADGDLDLLEAMTSLADKSLVRQEGEEESRFGMLETIREYAEDKLAEQGNRSQVQRQHAEYFAALVEEAEPELKGPRQGIWLRRIEQDLDNVRGALGWSLEMKSARGLQIGGALWRFWVMGGHLTEGRQWLEALLTVREDPEADTARRARALTAAGLLADLQNDFDPAQELYAESVRLWREVGDQWWMGAVANNLGTMADRQGDYERAKELYEEALGFYRQARDPWAIASTFSNLGLVAWRQGDLKRAEEVSKASLQQFRKLGDTTNIAGVGTDLGEMALQRGDYTRAQALLDDSLQRFRELGDKWQLPRVLGLLGFLATRRGDFQRARELHKQAFRLCQELGDVIGLAAAFIGLAAVSGCYEKHERVTRLLGAANSILTGAHVAPDSFSQGEMDELSRAAQAALGSETYDTVRQEGEAMSLEDAAAYALGEGE